MMKVMVVAVHPDDETLGCGGTLLRHKAENDEIYWLIVTHMIEGNGYDRTGIEKRKDQKIPVWRADIITEASGFETAGICMPGSIVKTISPKGYVVRCRGGFLGIETDTPLDLL